MGIRTSIRMYETEACQPITFIDNSKNDTELDDVE